MEDEKRRIELRRRLVDASRAHDKYQTEELGGVYHEQWSEWYAQYMLERDWNSLFTREWTLPELTEGLRQADIEQRERAPQDNWYDYYADYFLKM